MVGTTLTIEREIEDAWSAREASTSSKRRESQSSSSSRKKQRASSLHGSQGRGYPGQGQGQGRVASQAGQMVRFHFQQTRTYEKGLPLEIGTLRFGGKAVPVSCGTGEDIAYSSTP